MGGDPVLGVGGGKPAALCGEATDGAFGGLRKGCALGVGGTVHHGAGIGGEDGGGWIVPLGAGVGCEDGGVTIHHGAGTGGEDGSGGTVHHNAGHDDIPRLLPNCFRF